jgi:N-acetylmuramoyl-L-alanine amidase
MLLMKHPRRVAGFSRAIIYIAFLSALPLLPAQGNRWDSAGAAQAFQDARRMKDEISQASLPALSLYLECARTYRKVHVCDPHYSRTGDAIYDEGLVYQEMGEKFADLDFYRTAVKRFQLLIRDYSGNQNCPDALLRMGDIYLKPLNDEIAAQNTYRFLKTNYNNSHASRELAGRNTSTPTPVSPPTPPVPKSPMAVTPPIPKSPAAVTPPIPKTPMAVMPPAPKAVQTAPSVVQSVRHWSTSDYTRVMIDLDSNALYTEGRLSNPDRIYFDISGAKLSSELGSHILAVDDEFLKQVRISQNSPNAVRVVLDLLTKGDAAVSELHDPFRIVIDLRRQDVPSIASKTAKLEPPAPPKVAAVKAPIPEEAAKDKKPEESLPKPAAKQPMASAQSAEPSIVIPLPAEAAKDKKPEISLPQPPAKQPVASAQSSQSSIAIPMAAENRSGPAKTTPPASPASAATTSESKPAVIKAEPEKLSSASVSRAAEPTSLGDRTLTRMLGLKIGRIVIDPGHGGHDLGTIGPGGLLEKDLVLSIALDLQSLLQEKLGAQVILTRSDDTFIALEERSAMANQFRADLFISIHANSSRSRSTSGVETYYLNFAKTDAEREIASRENATSTGSISELEDLIKKIVQADKSTESKELASLIQKKLYSGARKMFPTAQNRGVRSAPFIVLIGANMPSILTEVAFISNPRDERLLKKAPNQERLVKALFSGIEDYMKTLGSDMAQNQLHRP